MNVSGIRPYSGYNTISVRPEAVDTKAAEVKQDNRSAQAEENVSVEISAEARARQTFGAYDYAAQYNPRETFEMVGAESDLKSLDVEKAISDMRKDAVLHQYQYFVGNVSNSTASDVAPERVVAENFTL